MTDLSAKKILITGGTGSFGKALVKKLLDTHPDIQSLTIFSRDEYKQYQMRRHYPSEKFSRLHFVLGDIRDQSAFTDAVIGTDIIIHAAALKQNPTGELYPDEFYKTNVEGTRNLTKAARAANVPQVLALSTDKAVYPTSAYGASKLCAEKLLMAAQERSDFTQFSVLRLGNLMGSRASVVPALIEDENQQTVSITHPDMTRFSLSLSKSVDHCLQTLTFMMGGEIFIPKMSAYRLRDLVRVLRPNTEIRSTGPRAAEKMHELALSAEEARFGFSDQGFFIVCPVSSSFNHWKKRGVPLNPHFTYSSNQPDLLLSTEELRKLIDSTK